MLKLVTQALESEQSEKPAGRATNKDHGRDRNYLTPSQIKKLLAKTHDNRWHLRDYLLVLMTYRHALRVSEAVELKWSQIDFNAGKIHVERLKNGDDSVHYLEGEEMRKLRQLKKLFPDCSYVFSSERGGPLTRFAVNWLIERLGDAAGLQFPVTPHMLRNAKGYQLANEGIDTRAIQGYLGHKNIQNTVIYTKLNANRFRGFGKDL